MLEELGGGVIRFVGRILTHIFLEVLLEFLVRGAGVAVCRVFTGRRLDSDSLSVLFAGLLFWFAVAAATLMMYDAFNGSTIASPS